MENKKTNANLGPGCSNSHIPGFMNHDQIKKAGKVFVVAVNDPFVTKAWGEKLDPEGKSGVSVALAPCI